MVSRRRRLSRPDPSPPTPTGTTRGRPLLVDQRHDIPPRSHQRRDDDGESTHPWATTQRRQRLHLLTGLATTLQGTPGHQAEAVPGRGRQRRPQRSHRRTGGVTTPTQRLRPRRHLQHGRDGALLQTRTQPHARHHQREGDQEVEGPTDHRLDRQRNRDHQTQATRHRQGSTTQMLREDIRPQHLRRLLRQPTGLDDIRRLHHLATQLRPDDDQTTTQSHSTRRQRSEPQHTRQRATTQRTPTLPTTQHHSPHSTHGRRHHQDLQDLLPETTGPSLHRLRRERQPTDRQRQRGTPYGEDSMGVRHGEDHQQLLPPRRHHTAATPTRPNATQSDDDDDDDDVPLSDLRDLLRQLPKDNNNPTMTAEEYLAIDDTLETGQALDDDDILCLVNRDDVPDAADDDDDDDAADDDDDDTQPTEVTTTQAREMITRLIPYFEQATEQTTSDERRENAAFLDQLWAMADVLQKRSTTRSRQTTIADFFKK